MLIGGRVIQGFGSGGVTTIVPVIVSDLVPLRQRGNYMALILTIFAIGTSLGPFIGGAIVQSTSWRWVFYINFPIGGTAIVLLFLFLHTSHHCEVPMLQRIKKIDVIGATILIIASVAILFALTYGGSRYEWSSTRIIVPLTLGLCGFGLYLFYEGSNYCIQPMTPLRLFRTTTAVVVVINSFINSCLLLAVTFFLPLYFQAILGSSPLRSGLQLLPSVLTAILGSAITALLLTRLGKYKLLHLAGFGLITLGLGLFSLLGPTSSIAEWVIFQFIAATGSGMVYDSLLPAFQAAISEKDQAAGTATLAFIRCFGNTWGFAIPAAIFNTRTENNLRMISDVGVRESLSHGQAYQHATREFIWSLNATTRQQVIDTFTVALKMVWWVSVVFAGIGFVLVFFEKDIALRKELVTEYGLKDNRIDGQVIVTETIRTTDNESLK